MSEDATLNEFVKDDSAGDEFIETAAGRIPSDWDTFNVEELCELRNGKATNHTEIDEEQFLVYGSNGPIGSYSESNFEGGLIFGRVGTVGEVERVEEPVWVSDNAIQGKVGGKCNTEYLYYYLSNEELGSLATKTAQPLLNQSTIGNVSVPFPSLLEQRKIATVLYTIDRAIEKTWELIEQLTRVRKGVFKIIFKRGVTNSNTKQARVLSIDAEIPEHWEIKSVSDISNLVTDGAHLTPEKSDFGYYLLGARNVQNGYVELDDSDYIPEKEYERLIDKCNPEPDDVLMSCRGVGLGRVALMPEGVDCALLCSAALIKLNDSVHPDYIEKALRHIDTQKQIKALQTQSAQPNLFQNEIQRLEFPLPPFEEQQEIARILSGYDDQILHEQKYKDQLKRLKHGLMQDLLSGKVRTTDTNIEVPDEIAQHG